jgi:cysteine/O-acetylserine efflux protein
MINFIPFIVYVFVTTFTPGPNNVMAMTNAIQYGFKRCIPFLTGIFSGFVVVMLFCGLLNLGLVSVLPRVKPWLDWFAAVYLVYLAIHIIRSKPVEDDSATQSLNSWRAGFVLQFLNVKVILYGITVFSLFITPSFPNPLVVSLFAPLLAGIGFVATSCWSIGGSLFRNFLRQYYRWFNLVMAALLIYIAASSLLIRN